MILGSREGDDGLAVGEGQDGRLLALEKILENPELGRTMGGNGRRWVCEEWIVDQAISQLEDHLVKVVNRATVDVPGDRCR